MSSADSMSHYRYSIDSNGNDNELKVFFTSIFRTIIILDQKYNYIYVNERTARTAGLNDKDLIGCNIWEKFPSLVDTIFEKNVKEAMEKREIRRFKWPAAYENFDLEFVAAPLDEGLLISCEEKGQPTLESNEEKYRYLLERAPVGICEINYLDFSFKSANEKLCKLLDYREEELMSMSMIDFLDGEDKHRFQTRINRALTGEKIADSTEYKLKTKEGQTLWAVLDMQLTYDDGKLDSVLIIIHDITERKQMQAKLEGYSKNLESLVEERTRQLQNQERLATIGAIAGMVGHDIRNPLQAMISDIYLLKSDLSSMPECTTKKDLTESLESVETNIGYINKIVADLQDYARPLNPEFSEINLSELIISIFETIRMPDTIKLSIDVKAFPKIKTDPTFLRRALTNIVNNAIQAMPDGGNLALAGFEKEDDALITVTDTGMGIPEELKPKLFTPMVTSKAAGQGLGLAVVKRLIEALNGKITFESQTGKGTTFTLTIPRPQA